MFPISSAADHDSVISNCVDNPQNWVETYSAADCRYYGDREWCTPTGNYGRHWNMTWGKFEIFLGTSQKTAIEACCVCGGGKKTWDVDNSPAAAAISNQGTDYRVEWTISIIIAVVGCVLCPIAFVVMFILFLQRLRKQRENELSQLSDAQDVILKEQLKQRPDHVRLQDNFMRDSTGNVFPPTIVESSSLQNGTTLPASSSADNQSVETASASLQLPAGNAESTDERPTQSTSIQTPARQLIDGIVEREAQPTPQIPMQNLDTRNNIDESKVAYSPVRNLVANVVEYALQRTTLTLDSPKSDEESEDQPTPLILETKSEGFQSPTKKLPLRPSASIQTPARELIDDIVELEAKPTPRPPVDNLPPSSSASMQTPARKLIDGIIEREVQPTPLILETKSEGFQSPTKKLPPRPSASIQTPARELIDDIVEREARPTLIAPVKNLPPPSSSASMQTTSPKVAGAKSGTDQLLDNIVENEAKAEGVSATQLLDGNVDKAVAVALPPKAAGAKSDTDQLLDNIVENEAKAEGVSLSATQLLDKMVDDALTDVNDKSNQKKNNVARVKRRDQRRSKRKNRKPQGSYMSASSAARVRSENVRRLKKYLSEQEAHDLANQASEILDLHRGKEKMLFKKLVNEFGGVLTYCSGTKSKRKKKRSGKSRTRQKDKSSTLNSSKEKTTFNRSVIVPTS